MRRGRTRLDASAAGHAFRFHETVHVPSRYARFKAAAIDSQCEGALCFFAGAHATVADDAFRWIVCEVRDRLILLNCQVVLAFVAVTHLTQAGHASHIL